MPPVFPRLLIGGSSGCDLNGNPMAWPFSPLQGLAELAVGGALGPADFLALPHRSQRAVAVTAIAALAVLDSATRNASAGDTAITGGDHALYTGGAFRVR